MADATTYNGLVASSIPTDPNAAAGGGTGVGSGGAGQSQAAAAAPAAAAPAAQAVTAAPITQSAAQAAPQASASQVAAASQAASAAQAIDAAPPPFEQWAKSQSDYAKKAYQSVAQQNGVSLDSVLRTAYDAHFAGQGFGMPEMVKGTPVIWGDGAGKAVAASVSPEVAANPLAAKSIRVRTESVGPDTQTDPVTGLPTLTPAFLAEQYGMQQAPIALKYGAGYDPKNPDENAQVKQLQTQLARAGAYTNGIDGLFGPITARGVAKYRADNNLGPGATLDNATIAHLEMNYPAGGVPTPQERPTNLGAARPSARPAQPGDAAPSGNQLVRQSMSGNAATGASGYGDATGAGADLYGNLTPAEQKAVDTKYGGGVSLHPTGADVTAAAQAADPFGTWLNNQDAGSLAAAAQAAGIPVMDYAHLVFAGNKMPSNPTPADTSLPKTFTAGSVKAGDYGIDVRQPGGMPNLDRGIASDGSQMATPEQMRAAAARAASSGAPASEKTKAVVTGAPDGGKGQDRVPATLNVPEAPQSPAPAEIFVPQKNPRPMSGDLSGLPQVAQADAGAMPGYTPPAMDPTRAALWRQAPTMQPAVTQPTPMQPTEVPGSPMGVRVPADQTQPAGTGTIPAQQPASVALATPQVYSPQAYAAFQPGQYYYDPQGNLRVKQGQPMRMAA